MTLLSNAYEETNEKPTTSSAAVSFSVINADTAAFGNYGKPNAIVRPVRRMESTDEPQQQDQQRPVGGDVGGGEVTAALVDSAESMANDMDTFARHLDSKLKGLQHTDKKSSSKNVIILALFSATFTSLIQIGVFFVCRK